MIRKIMIGAAAIAAITTTPTLAQTYLTPGTGDPMVGAAPIVPGPYAGPSIVAPPYGAEAYAAVPGAVGPIVQPGIYSCGQYLGWDPDPNIRFQLLRDACAPDGD